MHDKGFQIRDVESVKLKHLEAYSQSRISQGVSTRTIQNELAHIRGVLKSEGREVNRPEWSNKALNASGASRDGTNRPATREEVERLASKLGERDPGLRAMVNLCRELGLRSTEALRSGESLARWEKQLEKGDRVSVILGTKGGRPRETSPANRERALEAVREAKSIAATRGGRLLPGTLQQASAVVRNSMHRAGEGVSWHSLRYSYAQEQLLSYREAGYSDRESQAATSMDLGHGDGRGTYIAQVYSKVE